MFYSNYSGDLNNGLAHYSNGRKLNLIFKWDLNSGQLVCGSNGSTIPISYVHSVMSNIRIYVQQQILIPSQRS